MRTVLTAIAGVCSLGAGVGLSTADGLAPAAADTQQHPMIVTAVPMTTAAGLTTAELPSPAPHAWRPATAGARCAAARVGDVTTWHRTTLVCRDGGHGPRWQVVGG